MIDGDIKVVEKDETVYTNIAIFGYNSSNLEIYKGLSFAIKPNQTKVQLNETATQLVRSYSKSVLILQKGGLNPTIIRSLPVIYVRVGYNETFRPIKVVLDTRSEVNIIPKEYAEANRLVIKPTRS